MTVCKNSEAIFTLSEEEMMTLKYATLNFILNVMQNRQCYYDNDATALEGLIRLFRYPPGS